MGDNSTNPVGYDYFVSFADDAEEWVYGVLVPKLGRTGKRFALEQKNITGQLWLTDLQEKIAASHTVLLILSPQYLTSGRKELIKQMALLKVAEQRQWRVIPILVKSIERDLVLRLIDGLDFTKNYENDERLDALLEAPPAENTDLTIPPYPGMVAFKEDEAKRFFGREKKIEDYNNILLNESILVLTGASGCGKSSLAHAGMIPKLKQEHSFVVQSFRPRDQHLANRLLQVVELLKHDLSVAQQFVLEGSTKATRCLLFIDQFEELFSLENKDQQQAGLSDQAKQLLNHLAFLTKNLPNFYLLLTLRADFYPQLALCQSYLDLDKYLQRVSALGRKELAAAITQPALNQGVFIADVLVERLVNEAGDDAGILPFVQETMRALWSKRYERYIGLDAYENLGGEGVSGLRASIALKADAAYKKLPSHEHEDIAKRIFIRLIQFGEGNKPDTRRQQSLSALKSDADKTDFFEATLAHLSSENYRLLTISRENNEDDSKVDLVHEVLIDAWGRLASWLNQLRDIEQSYRYLVFQSERWEKDFNRNVGFLSSSQISLLKPKWGLLQKYGVSRQVNDYWQASIKHNNYLIYREIVKYFLVIAVLGGSIYFLWILYSFYMKNNVIKNLKQVSIDGGLLSIYLEDEHDLKNKAIRINSFLIDQYEVNNASFCQCIKVFECKSSVVDNICGGERANLPVVNINLANAQIFCEWIGRRLPLEIEWEMAAQNIENSVLNSQINKNIVTTNNESLEKTRDQVYGLYSNVSEWTLSAYEESSFFSENFWGKSQAVTSVTIKGGDFSYGELKPYYFRTDLNPLKQHERIGFRCVTNKKPIEVVKDALN